MIQRINIKAYPPLFQQASNSLSSRQIFKAEQQFKKCLQVNPSSYSSYLNLAYIAHINKDFNKAQALCDVAINIKPYCSQAYYNRCLAMIAQGIGKYEYALRDINSAYSCYYLEYFKYTGELQALQKAVSYSENNIQALRLLVVLSKSAKKQHYKNFLHKYEQWYTISDTINIPKSISSGSIEQGLFRLNGKTQNLSIDKSSQKLKIKILEYKKLKLQKLQNSEISKNSLQSCTYQLKIQPILNNIKQFEQNQQSEYKSQQYDINVLSSFDCDSIQIKRCSTNLQTLSRERSNYYLNIPTTTIQNRYSLAEVITSPISFSRVSNNANRKSDNSYKQNTHRLDNSYRKIDRSNQCNSSMTSSRFCFHHGCTKCTKENQYMPADPQNAIKMQIKTLQIFRNEIIVNPKPYLIIYDGQKSHITEVDQQGGHFPSWNRQFYLKKDTDQPYRIQLWHKGYKQKQDLLIGTATFQKKQGRLKSYFIKRYGGTRKTGYIFIQMGK